MARPPWPIASAWRARQYPAAAGTCAPPQHSASENIMAGHSKWANIKHKKAAADAKRGKI